MKKGLCIFIALICLLCGCQKKMINMISQGQDDNYFIVWENRQYFVYGIVKIDYVGEQIGILDGQEEARIYELKDYPAEEWLVTSYGELEDHATLLKEQKITTIPQKIRNVYMMNDFGYIIENHKKMNEILL